MLLSALIVFCIFASIDMQGIKTASAFVGVDYNKGYKRNDMDHFDDAYSSSHSQKLRLFLDMSHCDSAIDVSVLFEHIHSSTGLDVHCNIFSDTVVPSLTSTILDPNEKEVELESELLLDVSHLFLDFSIFFTTSQSILRTAQIVGRIFVLIQDYLPDKHIPMEELTIQIAFITIAIFGGGGGDNNRRTTVESKTKD
jgi:hypothetical protein